MRIEVFVKNPQSGVYESLQGECNPLYFAVSELLDERLDEVRLVLHNSLTGHYRPTIEVRIDIYEPPPDNSELNGLILAESIYTIVGNDNTEEFITTSTT